MDFDGVQVQGEITHPVTVSLNRFINHSMEDLTQQN